jgi:methylenetetrahydrofolate reductase (NADPH)
MARFMNEKIPGIFVPDAMIARLEKAADAKAECVAIAVETIKALRPYVQGFHLMAIGWEELIPEVVSKAGLDPR